MNSLLEKGILILKSAIDSVKPSNLFKEKILFDGNSIKIEGVNFELNKFRKIWILGAGKVSLDMGNGILNTLKDKVDGGLICGHKDEKIEGIDAFKGSHPLPDGRSYQASLRMKEFIKNNIKEEDLCIFLLSGGASSILCYPDFGLTIEDKFTVHRALLESGASIKEINTVRKHLSRFKGGKLAKLIPCLVLNLVISDVPGDEIESIGSGPLSMDSSRWEDVKNILKKYKLFEKIPSRVLDIIELGVEGKLEETLKEEPENVRSFIIGNNLYSLEKAKEISERLGFSTLILTSMDEGMAEELSKFYSRILLSAIYSDHPCKKPCCILAGGEAQVKVKGKGKGGRNQEFILNLLNEMRDVKRKFLFLSVDSDGIDGPTDASGAWIDENTYSLSLKLKIDPLKYLDNNDSYTFLKTTGNLIILGETSTNVSDIRIFLIE
ncbi:MAG: glycerate kinase type-2 family protein [Candidatus Aminicenantia bacterium]